MKCSCCGRRKKLFEAFEHIGKNLDVCVDCSQLLYKLKDAAKEEDKEAFFAIQDEIIKKSKGNNNNNFKDWYDHYINSLK